MSQQKKFEIAQKVREFRGRAKLSQEELGDRLCVSGNYISMIELGKKLPGRLFRKVFEQLEQSPVYRTSSEETQAPVAIGSNTAAANLVLALLSTETLIGNFVELAEKLSQSDPLGQKPVVGVLREYLDEIERRLLASSGGLSEAQQIAMKAAKPDASHGTK